MRLTWRWILSVAVATGLACTFVVVTGVPALVGMGVGFFCGWVGSQVGLAWEAREHE